MYGKIQLSHPEPIVVNSFCTLVFKYTVGKAEWREGGRIYICDRHDSDWSYIQTSDPTAEGYTSVVASGKARFRTRYDYWYQMAWHPWQHIFEAILLEGEMKEGDQITITYGDTSKGGPGIRAQSFVEPNFRFRVFVDPEGKGEFHELEDDSLAFPIVAGPWTSIETVCPSNPHTGTPGRIQVRALDQYGNTAKLPEGEMFFLSEKGHRIDLAIKDGRRGWIEIPGEQVLRDIRNPQRLHLCFPEKNYESISNPVVSFSEEKVGLFWGDIHGQSYVCDGTRSPEDLLLFAREEARLDFAAVTSHDCCLQNGEEDYQVCVEAANRAYVPREFTTFVGMEWSGPSKYGGDHNIYFRGEKGKFFNSGHIINQIRNGALKRSTIPPWARQWMFEDTPYKDLKSVYAELSSKEAMVIPHGGGRIANLEYHHPLLELVIEVFSCHESFESLACESLMRGYRMGFIGGSDDHRGALGDSHPTWRAEQVRFTEHGGLAAVYAERCTRDSIWKAFQKKSVYATTGARIILSFSINQAKMGQSIAYQDAQIGRCVHIEVHGTTYIRQIELWRNGGIFRIWRGRSLDKEIEFADEEPLNNINWPTHTLWGTPVQPVQVASGVPVRRAEAVYFVRVIQVDGHMAWSSPIWIDLEN